jgi:hypothetical protein
LTFSKVARELATRRVRYVLIGVRGANLYARSIGQVFTSQDFNLFVPRNPANLLAAWRVLAKLGMELVCNGEPLDQPRDLALVNHVLRRGAVVRAEDDAGLIVDLTPVMKGHDFPTVWASRRRLRLGNALVPVAPLEAIVRSKAEADRPKDRLFLTSHEEVLRTPLQDEPGVRRRSRARRGRARKPGSSVRRPGRR